MSVEEWLSVFDTRQYKIISPLSVQVSKNKKFILNMNNYRNSHYQTLNKAKVQYSNEMMAQLFKIKPMKKVAINYILFPKTKRKTDIDNVVSIHKKFFQDALVNHGVISDDSYDIIIGSQEYFGYVDKDNPRVEINLTEVS